MFDIFTDNWDEPPALYPSERLIRIRTNNPSDELYAIWSFARDGDAGILRDDVALALRRKFGHGVYVCGLEDVTDCWHNG